jgi:hypothetical protein
MPSFSDTTISCADAQFSKTGDPRYFWTEHIRSHGEEISLTWFDIGEPLLIHSQPNQIPDRRYGVCTVLIPALASSATASRRTGDPGRGNVRGDHSRRRRWHSRKAGRKRSEAELPISLRLLRVLHPPEHVELMRKALHTAGYASLPLFDACFGTWPVWVICRMSALRQKRPSREVCL